MFDVMLKIALVVTGVVSFTYGTRVAWLCGKRCQFSESPEKKMGMLVRSIPGATIIFLVGFLVLYSSFLSSYLTWLIASVTSSIVLAIVLVSIAMPDFKPPSSIPQGTIWVEKVDGKLRQISKTELNKLLEQGKIARFKRSSGWIDAESGKVRGSSKNTFYAGIERRKDS